MEEAEIAKIVQSELDRAESYVEARISYERALAYDYYYSRPFGNEQEGRSQVISADVAQSVDSAVPAIVKIFVSGDKAVEFTPRGPEDVKAAEQATLSANYVFFSQNNGYALAHDFIKDGLLQKTGVFKWKWDTSTEVKEKVYRGLIEGEVQILQSNPNAEIIEITPFEQEAPVMGQPAMQLYDVKVREKKESGRVKIIVVPPEEVKISPDAKGLDVMDMPFIAHTPMLTASDLVAMGVDPNLIAELPEGDRDTLYEQENIARRDRTDSAATLLNDDSGDPSQRVYRYDECYIRMDVDGDGIAELRKICKVGDVILHNDVVDHIPMAIWTPKVMPHEVVGISLADDVMDIQLLKSTIWRQALDNLYLSNAPRMFAQGEVNLDDLLTVRPGGVIRGEVGSQLTPIVVPFTAGEAFNMLEYADQEEETRTGISRMFQGIDPQAINKTATGVNAMLNQANARVELISRNAAEFGFKPLFKGILYLLAKHQTQALMVRLTNQFVPVDPETWSKEYDMNCNVGLGTGTKDQQLMQLQMLSQDIAMIAQSPFAAQLLDAKKVFNLQQKKAELAGFKDVTTFLNDPEGTEPPPPQKPPEIQKAEMQIQADQQKFQAQAQLDMVKMEKENEMTAKQAQIDAALRQAELEQQAVLEKFKIQMQMELEKYKAELQAQTDLQRESIKADYTVKASYASNPEYGKKKTEEESQSEKSEKEQVSSMLGQLAEAVNAINGAVSQLAEEANSPAEIIRGKDGRAVGVKKGQRVRQVVRGPDGRAVGVQ